GTDMKTALGLSIALLVGISSGVSSFAATPRTAPKTEAAAAQPACFPGHAPVAPEAKLDSGIRALLTDAAPHSFVIDLRSPAPAADFAALQAAGAKVVGRYPAIGSAVVSAPGTALPRLAALEQVVRISAQVPAAEGEFV